MSVATPLQAVTALLREAANKMKNNGPATKSDLQNAVEEIKQYVRQSEPSSLRATYAQAAAGNHPRPIPQKPAQNHTIKDRQIFISNKKTVNSRELMEKSHAQIKKLCNDVLTKFFSEPAHGSLSITEPIWATTKTKTGNITLTFKTTDMAEIARIHAEEWIGRINPDATVPQRLFAVVAHNVPNTIWNGTDDTMTEAIGNIESENTNMLPIDYSISSLSWLNGQDTRQKTEHGPLQLNFKSRKEANTTIDQGLLINGKLCNVSIYIPRAPQCFRCQDWGHRATECSGEARCGRCAGNHTTTEHTCTHNNPCAPGERCNTDIPKCANCGEAHFSWIRSCQAARSAFAAQTQRDEYRTGRYEAHTSFTFADLTANMTKDKRRCPPLQSKSPTPPSSSPTVPNLRIIPATSPIGPNA